MGFNPYLKSGSTRDTTPTTYFKKETPTSVPAIEKKVITWRVKMKVGEVMKLLIFMKILIKSLLIEKLSSLALD